MHMEPSPKKLCLVTLARPFRPLGKFWGRDQHCRFERLLTETLGGKSVPIAVTDKKWKQPLTKGYRRSEAATPSS